MITERTTSDAERELRRAAKAYAAADTARRSAIVAAREAGLTAREIGELVGLSHTAVLRIGREGGGS